MFVGWKVRPVSILQEPLGAAWYFGFLDVRTLPFPRFSAAPGKESQPFLPAPELHSKLRRPWSFCGRP
jgi:hypothetical protein